MRFPDDEISSDLRQRAPVTIFSVAKHRRYRARPRYEFICILRV